MAHAGLAGLEASPEGRDWLSLLPELLRQCLGEWQLEQDGEPFDYACVSLALPVKQRDGSEAVLKIQYPHRESEHEADALEVWDGDGAVRLLARDDARHALLIERCRPGTYLSLEPAERALDVLIGLLPRLGKRAGEPFHTLVDEAAWWISYLPDHWERADRPCERRLLDAALDALRELPPTQGEVVLLHQDLHGYNVLAAQREPWLVIDPKPLLAEREFAIAPIVRSFELGRGKENVLRRFDRLTEELDLDRDRARGWAIGQTLAWAFDSEYSAQHLETARWLLEAA